MVGVELRFPLSKAVPAHLNQCIHRRHEVQVGSGRPASVELVTWRPASEERVAWKSE